MDKVKHYEQEFGEEWVSKATSGLKTYPWSIANSNTNRKGFGSLRNACDC